MISNLCLSWINNFIIRSWPNYYWLLYVNELLWLNGPYLVNWLLHIDRLWLHNVSDRHWLLLYILHLLNWLLLWLLDDLFGFFSRLGGSLGLLFFFLFDLDLVGLEVTEEVELSEEAPLAMLASEPFFSLMDFHVLV